MGRERFLFVPFPLPCGSALWDPDLSGRKSWRYSPECVERLSEKGYEQHTERGFGRRREAKMGRKVPFRCSVSLHRRLLRPFSDSLMKLSEKGLSNAPKLDSAGISGPKWAE